MPTYEYECDDCAHHFEEFQGITEDKLTTCPECGKDTLLRLIGAGAAVLFKGSGFYQTDYRSQEYTDKAKSDSASQSSASSDSKADSKSDAKADAKSDSKSDKASTTAKSDSTPAESKPSPKPKPASGSKPKPKRKD